MTGENGGMRTRDAWWEALSPRLRTRVMVSQKLAVRVRPKRGTAMTRVDSPA